jgi:mRNA degradation ribonuclease J1/J2
MGVPELAIVENGAVVEVDAEGMRVAGEVTIGRIHLPGGEAIDGPVLHERTRLSEAGVVVVTVRLDANGRLADRPHIGTRGVVDTETLDDLGVVRSAQAEIAVAIQGLAKQSGREAVEQAVSRAARRAFRNALGFKPTVHAVVDMLDS